MLTGSRHLFLPVSLILVFSAIALAPAQGSTRRMEVTAYCPCGQCNGYTRGSWKYLKLDKWNRYVSEGTDRSKRYTGKTAAGERLVTPQAGLLSGDTVKRPWTVPIKVLPWRVRQRYGTIAADTDYYPFGTRMYVPGWGWGVVTDRGGDIKGPDRIDILYRTHSQANGWGRQHVEVEIEPGG